MGGSSSPVTKIVKKAKKAVTSAEGATEAAISFAAGPVAQAGLLFDTVTGKKTGMVTRPFATAGKEAGEKFVDQPKAFKKAQKEAEAQAEAVRQRILKEEKVQRKQSAAEEKAAETLTRARAAQTRRRKGTGRGSTILSKSLGGVGGEENQGRRSLLGL